MQIFPPARPDSVCARAGKITDKLILDQDQDQGLHIDLRSDQGQTNYVIFLHYEKIKIKIRSRSDQYQIKIQSGRKKWSKIEIKIKK